MELESERRRNMIFDSISNKENYKEEKEIYQTLNFLEKLKKWDDVESNAIIQKDWISANPKMKANACMKHIENILMYIISWKELKKLRQQM